jgi:hypothetical protein
LIVGNVNCYCHFGFIKGKFLMSGCVPEEDPLLRRPRRRNAPILTRSKLGLEMARRTFTANPMDGLSVDNPDDMRLYHDRMDALVAEVLALRAY